MKHLFTTLSILLCCVFGAFADYTDVPYSLNSDGTFTGESNYVFSTKTGYYQEWDHYVIFWSTGYGKQSGNPTSIGSGDYYLDLAAMKTYAEKCYDAYTQLGFLDPTSSAGGGHKIIILAYYSTDWFATGSGYGQYGTLNICHASANPSADNSYYTYCHEIAHAYQYLGNMKNGGNAGFQYGNYYGYVSYYENCGNWQAAQVYKNCYFPQMSPVFIKTTNLAFLNQWHCYQSYLMNDYFTEKRNITAIGDIWTINTNTKYADAPEKYMTKYKVSAEDLYKEFFFAAMRMVTWDLKRWDAYLSAEGKSRDTYMDHTPGTKAGYNATTTPNTYNDNCWRHQSTYQYVTTDANKAIHQVAYSSAPQSTGFNIIKLNVPTGSNRTITTTFTALPTGSALANGDNKEYWCGSMWATNSSLSNYNTGQTSECNSNYNTYKNWRGFRLGYVTYNKSTGERKYNFVDKVFCTGTDESSVSLQFTVPENIDELCLVVSPALSQYLRMGSQDPYNISSDAGYLAAQKERDQWPYRVQFYNTNIYGLSNPSTSFSGNAEVGKTYSTDGLPDMGTGVAEDEGSAISETSYTMTKNVTIDFTDGTSETTATITVAELAAAANQLQVNAANFAQAAYSLTDYTENQPANSLMFMPATPDGKTVTSASNCTSSDYQYGHWFATDGTLAQAGSSNAAISSNLNPKELSFKIAMPTPKQGNYTVAQALRYYDGEKTYATLIVKFNINVKKTVEHTAQSVEINKSTSFNLSETDYSGSFVKLSDEDLEKIAGCFGMSASDIKDPSNWESWSQNGPSEGKITLYGVQADGKTLKDTASTAEGYGFWFNNQNNVCAWGTEHNSTVFAEYAVDTTTFNIGQYPAALTNDSKPNITVAIVNTESGNKYIAYIHIAITPNSSTGINEAEGDAVQISGIYTIDGRKVEALQRGINILKMSDGTVQKFLIIEK